MRKHCRLYGNDQVEMISVICFGREPCNQLYYKQRILTTTQLPRCPIYWMLPEQSLSDQPFAGSSPALMCWLFSSMWKGSY